MSQAAGTTRERDASILLARFFSCPFPLCVNWCQGKGSRRRVCKQQSFSSFVFRSPFDFSSSSPNNTQYSKNNEKSIQILIQSCSLMSEAGGVIEVASHRDCCTKSR